MFLCFNPAGSSASHSCLLTPSQWDEEENWKKVKLMGWNKNSLKNRKIRDNNINNYKTTKVQRNWSPPADRCPATLCAMVAPPANCPNFIVHHDAAWYETSLFASLSQLTWLCPFPTPCASQLKKLKCPWLSVNNAWQHLKHCCVINIIFLLNPKHIIVLTTMMKINPMSAKIWQERWDEQKCSPANNFVNTDYSYS